MKKLLVLLALFTLFRSCATAQAPPNWMTVTAVNIHGGSNALLPAGSLTFTATDNQGNPIGFQAGGGGQMVTSPTVCSIVNGAITGQCLLANVSVSNPSNFCYSATITDNNNRTILGGPTSGYQCTQPQTTNFWCSVGTCNFDQYVPNLPAAVTALMPPPTVLALGGVYQASCTAGLVQTGNGGDGRPVCGSAIGTGNVVGSGLTSGVPLLGAGGNNIAIDTANVVALTGVDISTAKTVVGLEGKPLPSLATGYLNYTGSAWALGNPFASPTFTGTITLAGLADGCLNVVSSVLGSQVCGGGASSFQVNGSPLGSPTTINFANSAVFNGLTFTFSNPSLGIIQLGASGVLTNGGLQFSSTTVNGQGCALGSNCTIPFQTNGTNNASQVGENRVTSTANAIGLVATPINTTTNQAKIEISGQVTPAGLQFSSTTVNGQACALGGTCNVPFQTGGSNNASQAGLNFVASSTNALGLIATHINSTNQERVEITGALSNAGIASPFTTVNGTTCTLGATCTPLSTGITPAGANGTFWGVSGGVQQWLVPSGAGNVNGPGSSTVGHFAFFNNTSGTVLSDGGAPGPLATQLTGGLATGIAKVTTGTGLLSTAIAADFPTLNQGTTGNAATATQLSTTGTNGQFWGVSGGVQGYYTPPGGGNLNGSGLTNNVPLLGAGTTNVQTDVSHLVARTGVDISTADQVTGLRGAALPALAAGFLNYTGAAWAFATPVTPSPQFQLALFSTSGTAGVVAGDSGLTETGGVLQHTGQFQTDLMGFGNQAQCNVGLTYQSAEDCADYMEGTLGLRSGLIYMRAEIFANDPNTVNFNPDWRVSTGAVNSTVCDDTTLPVTVWSIAGNVVTFTATNTLIAGQRVQLNGFGTSTFFNGKYVVVIAAGLSGSQWSAVFIHANGGPTTEAGTFTPNLNCVITNAPLVFGSGSSIVGLGPVQSLQNMSGGSLITTGATHPKPVGKPTLGTFTCGGSGGPAGATYHFAVQFVVNLETKAGRSPVRGMGAYATSDVPCSTGQSTVTITAPTGGAAGSLAHGDYSVGVASALNGDYYVQQTGANGSMACGVAGTIDSLNDCKTTGNAVVTLANIQTANPAGSINAAFPMPADNRTGQPIDISNPMIVMGSNQPVSFLEQFRDIALACPPANTNGNNPNVMVYNISGQEGAGADNGNIQLYGDCGGYAGITGCFVYSGTHTPNSTWSRVNSSGGPLLSQSTTFYALCLDGRADGDSGASGTARESTNLTSTLKGGGTDSIPILLQGNRAKFGLSNSHFESISGNPSVYVTNGAHLNGFNLEGSTTGVAFRFSATAGFSSIVGACPQGIATAGQERCQVTAAAIQDDADTTGIEPLLGFVAHWASFGSQSVFGNQTNTGACVGCGVVFDHTGTLAPLSHTISDTCTLGTSCSVTFTGASVFTSASSYRCAASDATAANAVRVNQTSGSAVAFTGTGTDVISYVCSGH